MVSPASQVRFVNTGRAFDGTGSAFMTPPMQFENGPIIHLSLGRQEWSLPPSSRKRVWNYQQKSVELPKGSCRCILHVIVL
jgi:hypothetical protein